MTEYGGVNVWYAVEVECCKAVTETDEYCCALPWLRLGSGVKSGSALWSCGAEQEAEG